MTVSSFRCKLEARVASTNSLLCVGLDPHESELDIATGTSDSEKCDAAFTFCKNLIDATTEWAACYKPNAAFFEALGVGGHETLRRICRDVIPPEIPVLLDVKRGDIGSTAAAYAQSCYDFLGADAVTLSPLMGWDSVAPFVTDKYSEKGAFLLCKTSNPGSNDLLNLNLHNDEKLYERIASLVGKDWSERATESSVLGLVVGATDPQALAKARTAAGQHVWILAPGVGAQGGDLIEAALAGMNQQGSCMLIPVSRGISQAPDPSAAAQELCSRIQAVRQQIVEKNSESAADTVTTVNSVRPYQKEFLEFALKQGVLKFGSFVLKSGRTSPYFFNAGLFASGGALFRLGRAYASTIMASSTISDGNGGVTFDIVFGPAYKGIPLGAVVSSALYSDFGVDVGFAYNRKEAKDHGEGGSLVGAVLEGKKILIVDDVITAGTAIRESYEELHVAKAQVVGVVIALDRAEVRALDDRMSAVQAVARDLNIDVVSIVNLAELQSFLERSPDYDDATLQSVVNYRKEYGAD